MLASVANYCQISTSSTVWWPMFSNAGCLRHLHSVTATCLNEMLFHGLSCVPNTFAFICVFARRVQLWNEFVSTTVICILFTGAIWSPLFCGSVTDMSDVAEFCRNDEKVVLMKPVIHRLKRYYTWYAILNKNIWTRRRKTAHRLRLISN